MKFLPFFLLFFLSTPSKAITWKEFWEPFNNGPYYYSPSSIYIPSICSEEIYREEYVPGNQWSPGYVRRWKEIRRVPCSRY